VSESMGEGESMGPVLENFEMFPGLVLKLHLLPGSGLSRQKFKQAP
jgi:hypothetical protein